MFYLFYFINVLVWIAGNYVVNSTPSNYLNEYINYFEPLNYNKKTIDSQHLRKRRSLDDSLLHLNFNSHNRLFKLRLKPDLDTLGGDEMYFDGVSTAFDLSHIYKGFVEGVDGSHVHGSIIDGVFAGRIYFPNETFYVEKSEVYLSEPLSFHSVIYSEKNVVDNPDKLKRNKRWTPEHHSGCGMSQHNVHSWMERVQKSGIKDDVTNHGQERWLKYSYQMNRKKRTATDLRRQCSLYLQTDYTLWDYYNKNFNYDPDRIKAEITSLLATHVDGINSIYGRTTFAYDKMGPYSGFNFVVHRIQVNSSENCKINPNSGFCKPNLDASNFLNIQSLANHDLYCLAFVFSYRQFTQGTIGLAWVGSPASSGGVCERWKPYLENNVQVYKSLNTGMVTLCNYNSRVPLKVSILTFAHEVGHNFGSPHDSGPTCVPLSVNPNNKMGNYLMFSSATSGLQENNNNFSICSIGNITQNLDSIFTGVGGRYNCFKEREDAFCGNRIVEVDRKTNVSEECDCGFEGDCNEDCCFPRKEGQNNPEACTRKPFAACSKSEGPCCNSSNCQFVFSSENVTCKEETECSQSSQCNGMQAKCPTSVAKANLLPCNKNTQICHLGECTMSICEKISWKVCYAQAPPEDRKFDRGSLCFVSCRNPSTNSCVSTGNKDMVNLKENKELQNLLQQLNLYDSNGNPKGIQMPAGAPCDNFRGYCDVFFKCRAVNEEGPLAQLKKMLFNEEVISEIRKWVTTYWWVVLLGGIALIVLMSLFIKVCAVHTPSSNPKLKKARQLSLRRKRKPQQADMKLNVSSISSGADILRGPQQKTSRNL